MHATLIQSLKFLFELSFFLDSLLGLAHLVGASLLDLVALVLHLEQGLVVVLVVVGLAVHSGAHAAGVVLARVLRLVVQRTQTAHRHHADVLRHVLFLHEIVHVLFVSERAFFLVGLLLLLDGLQLSLDEGGDLAHDVDQAAVLHRDRHSLQLLLHLRAHALRPSAHLVVDQLDVLFAILDALELSLQLLLFSLQVSVLGLIGLSVVFRVHKGAHLALVDFVLLLVVRLGFLDLSAVFVGNLQHSHPLRFLTVQLLKLVVLLLILADSEEQGGVGLLLGHEFLDDFAHIRVVSLDTDRLKALLDVPVLSHLARHSLLVERRPEAVDEKSLSLLDLVRILGRVGCLVCDFSLALGPSQPLLQRILLVLDRRLQRRDPLLAFFLLVIDHLHQIVKLILALKSLLARLHLLVGLSVHDVGLGAQGLRKLVNLQRQRDQVLLLSVEHVIADALGQGLEQVGLFEQVQVRDRLLLVHETAARVLRNIVVLLLGFLDIFL